MTNDDVKRWEELIENDQVGVVLKELKCPEDIFSHRIIALRRNWKSIEKRWNYDTENPRDLTRERNGLVQRLLGLTQEMKNYYIKGIPISEEVRTSTHVAPPVPWSIHLTKYAPYLSIVFTFLLMFISLTSFASSFFGQGTSENTRITVFGVIIVVFVLILISMPIVVLKMSKEERI